MIHGDSGLVIRGLFSGLEIDRDAISRYLFKFMGKSEKRRILRDYFTRFLSSFFFSKESKESFSTRWTRRFSLVASLVLLFRQIGWVKLGGADKTPLGRE